MWLQDKGLPISCLPSLPAHIPLQKGGVTMLSSLVQPGQGLQSVALGEGHY
jgi:hypothetical protein